MSKAKSRAGAPQAGDYKHGEQAVLRPDVGVQEEFRAVKAPRNYRYDSSLDPELAWDESRERELGEWLLGLIERCAEEGEQAVFAEAQIWLGGGVRVQSLKGCVRLLKTLSKPFLNWAGKAERHQITVPTVPLFVHERHSTKAILETVRHRKARGQTLDLFADQELDISDRLDAYEHKGPWTNRMILGDSLQVMNSLLEYEGLGGQVQMIYMDPPYGVKFGSNFQPFVRKRDVVHGRDEDMIREPEMVKAYRDTWELGLHSYLTYLRDRLLLARELLTESGSIFVQISDENLHHVREVMDEVFGAGNCCTLILMRKSGWASTTLVPQIHDFLLWYARDKARIKFRNVYLNKSLDDVGSVQGAMIEAPDGETCRAFSREERSNPRLIPSDWRIFFHDNLTSTGFSTTSSGPYKFLGREFWPGRGKRTDRHWKTVPEGLDRLVTANRLIAIGDTLRQKRYFSDFPFSPLTDHWNDTAVSGFSDAKLYVVQTNTRAVERFILMTTDPGDLVLDPTCGSGTTAYVAEQWDRRWITCDTSRGPLALSRQRLLTATFPYYELKDPKRRPAGGFVYQRRQNRKGEEVGGLVPHITLKSIANNEEPKTEVLVDRPEVAKGVTRVTGPFTVEATIPAAAEIAEVADRVEDNAGARSASQAGDHAEPGHQGPRANPGAHIERMLEVLRRSETLRLPGNEALQLKNIRRLTDAEHLHAEASEAGEGGRRVAVVFGPEDGAISSGVVFEAAREAYFLKYDQLFFFGFAIQAKARELIGEQSKLRIPCTYVAVTPDVAMSDLLKTTRASEIFSVTGLPDIAVRRAKKTAGDGSPLYEVELRGLDIFNPADMETEAIEGRNLPAWMLDADYNDLCFYASQVFFPRTSAWDNLKKSLKASLDDSVWDHLAGTVSEPFAWASTAASP